MMTALLRVSALLFLNSHGLWSFLNILPLQHRLAISASLRYIAWRNLNRGRLCLSLTLWITLVTYTTVKFSISNLPTTKKHFIIHRTDLRSYTQFDNVEEFIEWYTSIPVQTRMFDEVIYKPLQKIRFDIDAPGSMHPEFLLDIKKKITATVHDMFLKYYS